MSEFDLGTGLLGSAAFGGSGATSYMKNIFGSRYRGYGVTDVGDDGLTSGGIRSSHDDRRNGYRRRSRGVA